MRLFKAKGVTVQIDQDSGMTIDQFVGVMTTLTAISDQAENSCAGRPEHARASIAHMHLFATASDDELRALARRAGKDLGTMLYVRREMQSPHKVLGILDVEMAFLISPYELGRILAQHDHGKGKRIPECCAEVIGDAMGELDLVPI